MARTTRVLADGIYFGEGPRWRDGRLWFSDFYAHAVKSVSLAGDLRTEFEIDDQPSGLGWMPNGDMLIVSMTKRQVLRRKPDGQISVHADLGHIATWQTGMFSGPHMAEAFTARKEGRETRFPDLLPLRDGL